MIEAPFAYITGHREIVSVEPGGRRIDHGLSGTGILWGDWDVSGAVPAAFSWPTWSPDGRHIACFRLPGAGRPAAAVFQLDADGIGATELCELADRLPIYLFWGPHTDHVAVLCQDGPRLALSTTSARTLGREIPLTRGSPLFFTWTREGMLAAFVGSPSGGPRLHVLDPAGQGPDTILPGRPGNFCAPLALGDRIVFVDVDQGTPRLVAGGVGDPDLLELERAEGLVAMVAGPDGRRLLRATAPGGDGTPYRRLGVIDVHTGEVHEIADQPFLAFQWLPGGDGVLATRVDTRRNLLEWLRIGLDGDITPIADLYPTRDLGFYLRFFEQYSQSHPLVDPSGRYLLLCGTLLGRGDPADDARLWRFDLHTGAAEDLGPGVFAVWGPSRPGRLGDASETGGPLGHS